MAWYSDKIAEMMKDLSPAQMTQLRSAVEIAVDDLDSEARAQVQRLQVLASLDGMSPEQIQDIVSACEMLWESRRKKRRF